MYMLQPATRPRARALTRLGAARQGRPQAARSAPPSAAPEREYTCIDNRHKAHESRCLLEARTARVERAAGVARAARAGSRTLSRSRASASCVCAISCWRRRFSAASSSRRSSWGRKRRRVQRQQAENRKPCRQTNNVQNITQTNRQPVDARAVKQTKGTPGREGPCRAAARSALR